MSEEIIKVLDNLGQKFGIAIDWTSQNITPYLQNLTERFIAYRNMVAIVQIIVFILSIILSAVCIKALVKWKKSDKFDCSYWSDDNFILCILIISISIAIIAFIGLIIGNTLGIIQNIYMPEITIIEYINQLTIK